MTLDAIRVRPLASSDLKRLASFTCSTGVPWEDVVEQQVRGPLPRRYLTSPPMYDGRMLVAETSAGDLLAVGGHHIEPTLDPDVGYTEVIAVALEARGRLITLRSGRRVSLGEMMLTMIFREMVALGRYPRTFVRVDRRNLRSLALCNRVGLVDERPEPRDPTLVQRWGRLPT